MVVLKFPYLGLGHLSDTPNRDAVPYSMTVRGSNKDPLDRHIIEKVQTSGFQGDILMNLKKGVEGAVIEIENVNTRGGDQKKTKSILAR